MVASKDTQMILMITLLFYYFNDPVLVIVSKEKKTVFLLRDYNAKLSKHEKNSPTTEFLDSAVSSVSSCIVQPISNWKTVINNIFSNISTDIRYASSTPSIETHPAVVRGLPKKFLPKCVNKKSSSERRYFVR